MIPKIIHYCWFGSSEIPDNYKTYISEWKELHSGWEIILWNEDNIHMDCAYMQNALKHKAWVNMSNFVRLYVLKNYGGIYLDTDMKILKPLDSFLSNNCFFGFEEGDDASEIFWVNNAIAGAIKNHSFINACYEALLEQFDGSEVPNESGPRLTTRLLKEIKGLKKYGYQVLDDVVLFQTTTFYPVNYEEAYKIRCLNTNDYPDSYAIHTWGRTWFTQEMMLEIIDQKQAYIAKQKQDLDEKITIQESLKSDIEIQTKKNSELELKVEESEKLLLVFQNKCLEEGNKINELNQLLAANQIEICTLEQEIKAKNDVIAWYRRTYIDRKLAGIIKDRIFKRLIK